MLHAWRPVGLSPGLEARRLGRLRWVACHRSLAAIRIYHALRPRRACDGAISPFRGSTRLTIVGAVAKTVSDRFSFGLSDKSTWWESQKREPAATFEYRRGIARARATRSLACPSADKQVPRRAENDLRYVWLIGFRSRRPARRAQDHMAPTEQASRRSWIPTTSCRVGRVAGSTQAQLDEPERPSIAVREDCTRDNAWKSTDEHVPDRS